MKLCQARTRLIGSVVSYATTAKDQSVCWFVATASRLKSEKGISAMDLAKRLLDYGFHAPTVYFPLSVKESIMIEPTETESRETLDAFAETLFRVIELLGAGDDPLHVDALKALLATFKGVLYEIYVLGEERAESLAYIQKLLQTLDRAAVPHKNTKKR